MASRETVEKVYALLGTTRPGADLTKIDIEACAMVLEPIPDSALLEAAVIVSRQEGDFLPSAGTLFQTALGLLDTELPADEAWTLVLKHSQSASLGANNPVKLPERAGRALELIGGDVGWSLDEIPFRRKEFIEVYGGLAKRWRDGVALGQLPAGTERRELADGK